MVKWRKRKREGFTIDFEGKSYYLSVGSYLTIDDVITIRIDEPHKITLLPAEIDISDDLFKRIKKEYGVS